MATVNYQVDRPASPCRKLIFDCLSPNAFATGWNKNAALVAGARVFSQYGTRRGQAVLAHEVSHAANGDMVTLALIQGVVNTFVIFLSRVVGLVSWSSVQRGHGPAFGSSR